jgi:hypothetical protein
MEKTSSVVLLSFLTPIFPRVAADVVVDLIRALFTNPHLINERLADGTVPMKLPLVPTKREVTKVLQASEDRRLRPLGARLAKQLDEVGPPPRAANSRGPRGPTGPLGTPSRTPWILSR